MLLFASAIEGSELSLLFTIVCAVFSKLYKSCDGR